MGAAYVTAAAVNLVMSAREDPETRAARARGDARRARRAAACVGAARARPSHARHAIYGPDLMAHFCARAAQRGTPMYLYGGRTPEALELLQQRLEERFPGIRIVGGYSPPFRELTRRGGGTGDRRRSTARARRSCGSARASPSRRSGCSRMRPRLAAPLLVGVGAAFDFHAGLVSQAPAWMQRNGLEWVYRLSREPRRLWRRYARYNPRFIVGFAWPVPRAPPQQAQLSRFTRVCAHDRMARAPLTSWPR